MMGTINPYRKRSVNIPIATVARMKMVLERASRAHGRLGDAISGEITDEGSSV